MVDILADEVAAALARAGESELLAKLQVRRERDTAPRSNVDVAIAAAVETKHGSLIPVEYLNVLDAAQLAELQAKQPALARRSTEHALDGPETYHTADAVHRSV